MVPRAVVMNRLNGTGEERQAAVLLRTLGTFERMRREIEEQEYLVVACLQELGVPWSAVGDVYGITRQAARDRFVRARRRERPSATASKGRS